MATSLEITCLNTSDQRPATEPSELKPGNARKLQTSKARISAAKTVENQRIHQRRKVYADTGVPGRLAGVAFTPRSAAVAGAMIVFSGLIGTFAGLSVPM